MSLDLPNRIHICSGETTFGFPFGPVRSVTPIHFPGFGHKPHIEARFTNGLRADFTPADFAAFLREGERALVALGFLPEIHDAVGGDADG